MITEKSKILELNRIKNLTEFGINIKDSQIVFSKDKNNILLYTEQTLALANLEKKTIENKYTNDKNGRISKVKFNNKSITYINQKDDYLYIVITSTENLGEYYEYISKDVIIDYLYIESDEGGESYLITINNKGDLNIIKDLKKIISSNIVKDTRLPLGGMAVSHIEYIKSSRNLVIILANGAILNYLLQFKTDDYDDLTFQYIDKSHIDAFNVEGFNDNLYAKPLNGFQVSTFKYCRSDLYYDNYELSKYHSKLESKEYDDSLMLFYISYTKKETEENQPVLNSYIAFFGIEQYGLTYHNKLKFTNAEIVDTYLYRSNNENIQSKLPSYLIICTRTSVGKGKSRIQVFSSDFFTCYKSIGEESISPFILINEFDDDQQSILQINILGAYVVNNPIITPANNIDKYDEVSVISDKNKYNQARYAVNVILRLLENYNNYELYINDIDIKQKKDKFNKLTSDVNEFLSKGYAYDEKFKADVFEVLQSEYKSIIINDAELPKVDFFILLLIYNNNLHSIKNYLSKKRDKEYLVSNETIFFTGNVLFESIKKNIYDILRSNYENYQFFTNDRLFNSLIIIRELFRVSKKRISVNYDKPFEMEENILSEDNISIFKALEEIEKILLMIKIARSYIGKIIKEVEGQEDGFNNLIIDLYNIIKKRKDMRTQKNPPYLYFELFMLSDFKDIYPKWKTIFLNFFIKIYDEKNDNKNPDGQVNLYFSKLQIFFFYFYVVADCEFIKSGGNVQVPQLMILQPYFTEMKEEWQEYASLCLNVYKLDLGINNIEIGVFSQFLRNLNKQNLQESLKTNLLKINFNSTFITMLKNDGFGKEALELSKNFMPIIHNEEDLKTHLFIFLENGLFNLAYQFLSFSFTFLIEPFEPTNTVMLQSLMTNPTFNNIKNLYFELFEFLIKNKQIDFLFCLPFNLIENLLLKIYFTTNKEYEELLYLYYNKLGLSREATSTLIKINENELKPVFRNILIDYELLHHQKLEIDNKYNRYDNLFKIDYLFRKVENRKPNYENINLGREVDESLLLGKLIF
jgi:hypothetical protein